MAIPASGVGIAAQPVGPGPAAPAAIFIDANMTFPQFLGTFNTGPIEYRNSSASITVTNFDGQGELAMIPVSPIAIMPQMGTNLAPSPMGVAGMSISGNVVNFSLFSQSYRNNYWSMDWNAYKIYPRADQSYGVTFSNSANFFAINDGGVVGQCVWAYQGPIGDGTTITNLPGGNQIPNNAIIFAYWNQADTVVYYTPYNRIVRITHNRYNNNGGQSIGLIKMVAFANTGSVPEHNGGFNIYNPTGTSCVFSTYNTPFMIRGFVSTAGGAPGIPQPMVALTATGVIGVGIGGNQNPQYQHFRGVTNQGGVIGTGWGPLVRQWVFPANIYIDSTTNIALPVLSATDYFA